MSFPIDLNLNFNIPGSSENISHNIKINNGLTTLIGPNGSGKTQLLRAIKESVPRVIGQKKVRFLSAGRIGLFEQFRSDYDGHRGNSPLYEAAQFGSKTDSIRRHNYETIVGDYHTLSVRPDILVKVQERLKKLFKRSIFLEWDGGNLKVLFRRNDDHTTTYSSAREASGLLHLVAILTSLYDDDLGALILDEPEVSLHPQLQSFITREILKCAGDPECGKKIVFIATHSTEFIKINKMQDLCNLIFCYDLFQQPIQIPHDASELKNKKLNDLISRMGQEHKLAFFCKRPLLVEGPSDVILCSGIEKILDYYIEASGVQIVPVIGKGEFPAVYKFFKLIGKEPIILTDADSYTDSLDLQLLFSDNSKAHKLVQKKGYADLSTFARTLHSDFCKIADSKFDVYKRLLEKHNYWINKKDHDDHTKIYRRAFFSCMFIYDPEFEEIFENDSEAETLKIRLVALLDVLENVGCFILRKGTIESYYKSSDKNTSNGKPVAAVEEVDYISTLNKDYISENYREIVECLKYASRTELINEVESLRELLLAVLAPVLAILTNNTIQSHIDSIVRNILGERGKLFKIQKMEGDDERLLVDIDSDIIETNCFPFEVQKSENLIQVIDLYLGFTES